ncbi:hypothetical protein WM41_1644 [Corynebacterium simulans]|uniref:Uncharacterized protein n=1 Tax=Corynebacterium simulans TaxID=146827 RepID=A0ABR5V9C6_9CORY|nr:hypothetical protein WM41_1644 [Corynebacterium simulans]
MVGDFGDLRVGWKVSKVPTKSKRVSKADVAGEETVVKAALNARYITE